VSLWYVVETTAEAVTEYDRSEFDTIAWLTPTQVLERPLRTMDPELHRFVAKLHP
jgi:hypothetical protein